MKENKKGDDNEKKYVCVCSHWYLCTTKHRKVHSYERDKIEKRQTDEHHTKKELKNCFQKLQQLQDFAETFTPVPLQYASLQ